MIRTSVVFTLGLVAAMAVPQAAPKGDPIDPIVWKSNIGSFKLLNGNGTTTFSFNGTVLISGLEGTLKKEGNLKEEYNDKKKNRVAYFGTGRITVTGKWRGIQVFGRNLTGRFAGYGFMRMVGEFDKDLNTGSYWFESKPNRIMPWYTSSMTIQVPPATDRMGSGVKRGGGK
jgi:hypothetical protein